VRYIEWQREREREREERKDRGEKKRKRERERADQSQMILEGKRLNTAAIRPSLLFFYCQECLRIDMKKRKEKKRK